MHFSIFVSIGALAVCSQLTGIAAPLTLAPAVDSSRFKITTFAAGVSNPYSMQKLPDGSIIVGATSGPDYFHGTGSLVRFTGDGVATGSSTVVANISNPVQGVRLIGSDLLAVSQVGFDVGRISFYKIGADPSLPYTPVGSIDFAGPLQVNMTIGTRPTPGQPNSYDLFFNTSGNDNYQPSKGTVTVSGLASGTLPMNALLKTTITPTAGFPTVGPIQQVASGLRNTAGIVVDPVTGNLYINDNGFPNELTSASESADELNRIMAGDIGSGVANFGFPQNYTQYQTNVFIGGQGIPPIAAFQPDLLTGFESLGISEMALAPANFPAGWNNGLFIAFYGTWEQTGAANTTGPLLYFDFATETYRPFVLSGQPGIGHMATLMSTQDSLYIADMASSGTVRSGSPSGVIYRISAASEVPEPQPALLMATGLAAVLGLVHRRNRRPSRNISRVFPRFSPHWFFKPVRESRSGRRAS